MVILNKIKLIYTPTFFALAWVLANSKSGGKIYKFFGYLSCLISFKVSYKYGELDFSELGNIFN